jgi:ParB family chromosome partitioning protein
MPNNTLGRGLSSLIPQKVKKIITTAGGESVAAATSQIDEDRVLSVSPEKIQVNPRQPRQHFGDYQQNELAESIKQYGIIQPLVVTEKNGEYELIAGERRLRAAKALGLATVPVIIRQADEQQRLELALVENLQRQDLNSIETALAYRRLIDEFNLGQEELARRLGKSRPVITNTLRFLNLPQEIQQALIDGRINEGQAKIIVGLPDQNKQFALYEKITRRKMTLDDTMRESRVMGGTKMARIKVNYVDQDKELAFREFFGAKTEIRRHGRGGEVILYFYSDEELREMVGKIRK